MIAIGFPNRRRAFAAAWLLALLVVIAASPVAAASYEELVAEAKQGKTIDYAALRNAYAESPRYDAYNGDLAGLRGPFQKAFADGDCASAIKQGEAILEKKIGRAHV